MDESIWIRAVNKVISLEGGYVNDPDDSGGATKFGISQRSYPNIDIRNLTRQEAIEIYRRDFWEPNHYGEIIHQPLAEKIFDMAVNMGAKTANRLLQKSYNAIMRSRAIQEDGIIGPITIRAINDYPYPDWLLAVLRLQAIEYYLQLRNQKYLAGWIKRALA